MIDHLGIQAPDVAGTAAFYIQVFAPLGFAEARRIEFPGGLVVGLAGPDGQPHFWISPLTDDGNREIHVAFGAPSRAAVDAVERGAREWGAEILHAAREFPEYHPGYYGVFVRDPAGNNAEAVFHG